MQRQHEQRRPQRPQEHRRVARSKVWPHDPTKRRQQPRQRRQPRDLPEVERHAGHAERVASRGRRHAAPGPVRRRRRSPRQQASTSARRCQEVIPRSSSIVRAKDDPSMCRLIVENTHPPPRRAHARAAHPVRPTGDQRQEKNGEEHRRLRADQLEMNERLPADRRGKKKRDLRLAEHQRRAFVRDDPDQQQSHQQRQRGDKLPHLRSARRPTGNTCVCRSQRPSAENIDAKYSPPISAPNR